jgi:hypothetical protein
MVELVPAKTVSCFFFIKICGAGRGAKLPPCEIIDRLASFGIAYENLLRLSPIFSRCDWNDAVGLSHACDRRASSPRSLIWALGHSHVMSIPEGFRGYQCAEYFEDFARGVWSESEQMWLIVSAGDVVEREDFLVIGRAGVDGIEFGYRRDAVGIWAHYPIEGDFRHVAPSVRALVEGWLVGNIRV